MKSVTRMAPAPVSNSVCSMSRAHFFRLYSRACCFRGMHAEPKRVDNDRPAYATQNQRNETRAVARRAALLPWASAPKSDKRVFNIAVRCLERLDRRELPPTILRRSQQCGEAG